jgi:hypothetical protein
MATSFEQDSIPSGDLTSGENNFSKRDPLFGVVLV